MLKKIITLGFISVSLSCNPTPMTAKSNTMASDTPRMFDIVLKCQNRYFSSENTPIRNKLIVFFSASSCPSCIIELDSYIKTINRKYSVDVNYYTSLGNKNMGGVDKLIPSLKKISVDTVYSNLEYPIIFETNNDGRIVNCMPINSSYLYVSFDYIKKYALNHPMKKK